jgi:NADH:ubiquinone oxidoreductase subunit 5 (subunit L)/multisubunit Na+/H+ antiporter MnhA subunit
MVAFWDVLALVLLLVSIAFLVLTVVLVVALLWTKKFKDSSQESEKEKTASRVRTVALAMAGVIFLILAVAVLSSKHSTLSLDHDKSDTLTAVGTVSGDFVTAIIAGTTLYALILLRRAVSEQVKQLTANAVQNVGQEMLKIDRWMADNPNYLMAVGDKLCTPLGAAVAQVHADLIDQVVSQASYLPPEYMPLWTRYFEELIREWPQLEKFMDDHRHWYGKEVAKLIDAANASDSAAASGDAEQQRQNTPSTP